MEEKDRLTTKEYWTPNNPEFLFERHQDHAVESLIKKYIPATVNGNCLEIGSFPGPFLAAFGDLGYILNGIDFHPKNERELPAWLRSQGFKTGEFKTVDFFEYRTERKFDVVASFGFIEHFDNYKEVILKHAALVNENGYLVITTPNFGGRIQHWLHKTFDRQNLDLHNLESMQPAIWAKLLADNGYEILYNGFLGGFLFWRNVEHMNLFKQKLLWVITRIIPRLRKLIWFESPAFSGYCGVVAKKIKKENI
jgi:L-malate glycosyltransferase